MKRVSFEQMECPIAQGLEQVGEWWSMLILRDAFDGLTRFDQFERSLGIAPNMLTRRLRALTDAGLLERRRYHDHPPRYEYVLTDRGLEFQPVLLALWAWAERRTDPADRVLVAVDGTGKEVEPVLVDRLTGRPLEELGVAFSAGPGASDGMRRRFRRQSTA